MKKLHGKMLYIAAALVVICFSILFFYILIDEKQSPEENGLLPICVNGMYSADGGEWQPLQPGNQPVEDGRRVVFVQGSFHRDIPENETIWFRTENTGVKLAINGRPVFACNQPGTFPAIFHAPGYAWYSFQSPGITASDIVLLEMLFYYGDSGQSSAALLGNLYVGDGSGLYRMMAEQSNLLGLAALISMIAGLIYLLEGLIDKLQRLKEANRILLLGFYLFTGALWCITDSLYPYFSLILSPPWLVSAIDMLGVLLFPISLVLLVRFFIRGVITRQIMDVVVRLSVLAVLAALLLQLCGIFDLRQQQPWISGVAVGLLVVLLACIWSDLKRYKDNYMWLLFLAIVPAFIAMFLDGANVIFSFMPRRVLMRVGFNLSAILMISQLFSYARKENEVRQNIQHMESELLESRISIMLSQIQPHFLYNSLLGIKQLCDTNPPRASEALEHFSYYLRGNLDSLADTRLIPFEKEMEHVNDYLYLEKMRFSKKLNLRFDMEFTDFMLPPLTVQPIVENAVRYGIVKKRGGGTLTIKSEQRKDAAVITISDNGVGFDPDQPKADDKSHTGIKNVRDRLCLQCGGSLLIESGIGVGTVVKIILPQKEGTA